MAFRVVYFIVMFELACGYLPSRPEMNPSTTPLPSTADYYGNYSLPSSMENSQDTISDGDDDGKADNLADYVVKKVGQLLANGEDLAGHEVENTVSTSGEATAEPTEETLSDLKNCSQPATLDHYCEGVPEDVRRFFDYNLSVQGILHALFRPDIINTLQTSCSPGEWCLPYQFHQDILDEMDPFYEESPICSDAMWSCLQSMLDLRFDCHDKELDFLVNGVLLLCDLRNIGSLGPECYARTKEAAYVTYVDLISPNGSRADDLQLQGCNDFKVKMSKSYLCADDVCGFDQNLILEKFVTWLGLTDSASDVAVSCNISSQCQTDYPSSEGVTTVPTTDYYYEDDEETSKEYEEYKEEMAEIEGEIQKELNEAEEEQEQEEENNDSNYYGSEYGDGGLFADSNNSLDEQDRTMLYGLIAMTTVLTLGLFALAFVGYRRYRRCKSANYRRGYSQLSDEEAKMLRSDYN